MRVRRGAPVKASSRRTGGVSMQKIPAAAVWGLGVTQIIGYGTIFYSFSILAPAMARIWAGRSSGSLVPYRLAPDKRLLSPVAGRLRIATARHAACRRDR